jgi:hypothetical protein
VSYFSDNIFGIQVRITPSTPKLSKIEVMGANDIPPRSQGAAVMHSAVGALPDDVKKATIGGVLFGSTKNKQEDGKIRNYPPDRVMMLCVEDDGVCWGRLSVTGGVCHVHEWHSLSSTF